MKVGAGTRDGLRTLFEEHELRWDWPDAVLDAWVRSVRSQLGRRPNNLEDEQAALVLFQLQALSDASFEVWNGLMWEVLQVCVAKTQSPQRFPFMMEAENDAWEEVVASWLDRCEGATREHQLARWHFACAAWTGAVLIGMRLWVLPMSGRRTLTSITVAICLVGIGEGRRRYGYDIPWGRTVDLLGSEACNLSQLTILEREKERERERASERERKKNMPPQFCFRRQHLPSQLMTLL